MLDHRKKRIIEWVNSIENEELLSQLESIAISTSKNNEIKIAKSNSLGLNFEDAIPQKSSPTTQNYCSDSEIVYLKKYFTYLKNKKK
jgi:hypothetical protein